MPTSHKPRSGSLAFYPRKRAKRIYPRLTVYPAAEKPKVMGFAGYKVGMVHAIAIDARKGRKTFGQEISLPVTVLDCPPFKVVGFRAYTATTKGLDVFGEVWDKDLPKDIARKINLTKKKEKADLEKFEKAADKISDFRAIVCTQPRTAGMHKKTPEIFEVGIGGKVAKEKFEYVKQMLGKEVKASDIVKEGELVDVVAVTKGKGMAGPVKRFGVKIQRRKAHGKRRHVGAIAAQSPGRVRWTVAMAGQLGFQTRTEYNKRVLKIGEEGKEITPKSGFNRYGLVNGNYMLLEGSVPGAKKRLIMLRPAIRPSKIKLLVHEIKQVVS
jgi:large subunit ribosomal protein L3